jgi:hypothetical protein
MGHNSPSGAVLFGKADHLSIGNGSGSHGLMFDLSSARSFLERASRPGFSMREDTQTQF